MEEKTTVPDRRLLARLVLVREEARSLLSGGLLDERNDRTKFRNLPEPEVNFLSKIVGLRPGPDLHKRLANVIAGQDEGADIVVSDEQGHPRNSKAQAPPCNLSTCKFSMCSCVFRGFLALVNWVVKLKESCAFSSHNNWCSYS
jgi:hypothetical protein